MAIKWKNWTRQTQTKIICLILAVLCLVAGSQVLVSYFQKERELYIQNRIDHYIYSINMSQEEYARHLMQNYLRLPEAVARMKSEEYIGLDEHYTVRNDGSIHSSLTNQNYFGDSKNLLKSAKIESVLSFRRYLYDLEQSGLDYYIRVGTDEYGSPDVKNTYYYEIKNNEKTLYSDGKAEHSQFSSAVEGDVFIYLGTNAENFKKDKEYMQTYEMMKAKYIAVVLGVGLLGLVALGILVSGTGRRKSDDSDKIYLHPFDQFPLDVSLALIATISAIVITLTDRLLRFSTIDSYLTHRMMAGVVVVFPCLLLIFWFLSLARWIKHGGLWDNLLSTKILKGIGAIIRDIGQWIYAFPYKLKAFVYLLLAGIAAFSVIVAPPLVFLFGSLFIIFVFYTLHGLDVLKQGVSRMEHGDYTQKIAVTRGEFASVARSLENISHNMDTEVSKRLQSELYKTELITNVSHDLRTPLTSLITYTDLLKTKGLDDPDAPEYLEVLIQKSQRLKTLTDDLFEATKAASGSIQLSLETLDLTELVEQSLGEFNEQIVASQLSFMSNLPPKALIFADGSLMWRVLENLLSNVLKYSMNGTRVYIDVLDKPDFYCLEIKNISKMPLNIPVDQLTNRFQRGDTARSSEGSGLGLSIVQNFVEAQHGDFAITVDGDLFKTSLCLPKAAKASPLLETEEMSKTSVSLG